VAGAPRGSGHWQDAVAGAGGTEGSCRPKPMLGVGDMLFGDGLAASRLVIATEAPGMYVTIVGDSERKDIWNVLSETYDLWGRL